MYKTEQRVSLLAMEHLCVREREGEVRWEEVVRGRDGYSLCLRKHRVRKREGERGGEKERTFERGGEG